MNTATPLAEKEPSWITQDNAPQLTVELLGAENIGDILSLQGAVAAYHADHQIEQLFLKKRNWDSYKTILDDGGVIFGIHDRGGNLLASSCVNNALGQGRVEIVIDEAIDKKNVAVFQGTMAHPDTYTLDYRLADILYIHRAQWAFDHNKTDVFASVCCNVLDPRTLRFPTNPKNTSGDPYKNGNWTVINGLTRKGFEQKAVSNIKDCDFKNNLFYLDIMTLGYTLPDTQEALYTDMHNAVRGDIAKKWLPPKSNLTFA